MNLTQISPTPEQITQLMAYPKDTPVTMVNILKFKEKTVHTNETGLEAYTRYVQNVQPFISQAKATLLWKGYVVSTVIGDATNQPDVIMLVTYPSVLHFLKMAQNPNYQKAAQDRAIALEYGGLIACTTQN